MGSKLPNITNSIDLIHVNTDAILDSIVDDHKTNTMYAIPKKKSNQIVPVQY